MSRRIRQKVKTQELIQAFIDQHKLGFKIARQKLGLTPQFIVLEGIQAIDQLTRSGIMFITCRFNSSEGGFEGSLAIKEFNTEQEAQHLVDVNKWLFERVRGNPRINVPQIFSAGGGYICYEGIEGFSFHESHINVETKFRLAGEALATYHTISTAPVNQFRYLHLLEKLITTLPINQERKDKLISFGMSLLTCYNKEASAVYGYGDYHPENIIISTNGDQAFIINPEFIETEISADRFEDIATFFVYDAFSEFESSKKLNNTLRNLETFVNAYNSYLKQQGLSLESIYKDPYWIAISFHLGLMSLIRGASTTLKVSDSVNEKELNKIILSYKLTRYIWGIGAKHLKHSAYPPYVTSDTANKVGWLITWCTLGNAFLKILNEDSHFQILFDFPQGKYGMSHNEATNKWHIENKKDLENKISNINDWFNFKLITMTKDAIEIIPNWKTKINLQEPYEKDWELSAKILFGIWKKNPLNALIIFLKSNPQINLKDLEEYQIFDKKILKQNLDKAKKQNLITMSKNEIILNPEYKNILNLPPYFEFTFFD
ncbi:MAG: hypothetical protein ACXAC7_00525 [Candidatus Hodarchaeales archaeon]|jgi:hypothetical protein